MKMYPVEELLNRWAREELTVEQAVGQILQHLVRLKHELDALATLAAKVAGRLKGEDR
jgi:hypothetical protein